MEDFGASIQSMIKAGKTPDEILSLYGFAPSSIDPELRSFMFNLLHLVADLMSSVNTSFEEARGRLDTMSSTIEALTEIINDNSNKNSRNSSLPPSSDGYRKPPVAPRSLRGRSGKTPGGQDGHAGHGLKKVECDEKRDVDHYPRQCLACPRLGECIANMKCIASGHVYEARTILVDNEHKAYSILCPVMERMLKAELPDESRSSQQYGGTIRSTAVGLWSIGVSSIARIPQMVKRLTGTVLSSGTAYNFLRSFAHRCDDALGAIRNYLASCNAKGADETGLRAEGRLHWLHVVCDGRATYLYADRKRGFDAIRNDGLLLDASGALVHDCWSAYFNLENMEHAICLQHIQRELRGAMEREKEYADYFKEIEDLLLEMREAKLDAMEAGESSLEHEAIKNFKARFLALIDKGLERFPQPKRRSRLKLGKMPQGKTRSLLLRLKELQGSVFLFLENFEVEFTNNESERSLRGSKVRQSISKCFRTEEGLSMFAKINSVLDTAAKNGIDKFEMIEAVFNGTAVPLLQSVLYQCD